MRSTSKIGDPSPQAPDGNGMVAALAVLDMPQVAAGARMGGTPPGDMKPGGSRTSPAVANSEATSGALVGTSSPLDPGGAGPIKGGAAQGLDAVDVSSATIPVGKAGGEIASAALPEATTRASPAANPPGSGPTSVHTTAAAGDGSPTSASADVPAAAFTASSPTTLPADMAGGQPINGAPLGTGIEPTISAGSGSAQTGAAASDAATGDPAATSSAAAFPPATAVTDDTGTAIRVTSGELGTVEVKLGTSDDGTASVTVAADRAETLNALAADRDQMQSVLAEAGIEPAGRRIEYTLLTADAAPAGSAMGQDGGDRGGGRPDDGTRDAHADASFFGSGRNLSQNATQLRSASKTHYVRRTTVDITA